MPAAGVHRRTIRPGFQKPCRPLFGLAAGAAADRVDRRAIMLAADVGRALALAALALVVAFHPVYWPIPLLAFAEGTGDAFFGASAPGATRAVVPAAQVHAAFMAALRFGYARLVSTEEYLAEQSV